MTDSTDSTVTGDFLVRRGDLRVCTFAPAPEPPAASLKPGEVMLRIERFALTANNITYGAFGEAMSYWNFFPVTPDQDSWGRIPVWGFATVAASTCEGVAVGERFYGYYPMSGWLQLTPVRVNETGFVDGAAHRTALPAVYNQYLRTSADPAYRADSEAQQMLLRPLFITSFLIDDFLADNAFFGARRVILSSASSKTAYGLAFCLARRGGVEVVGLTSPGNAAFVARLGCYNKVVTYDQVAALAAPLDAGTSAAPSVLVDMAGNAALRRAVHEHLGDALSYSCSVGGTHWDHLGSGRDLPGPKPVLFFAPAQIKKRHAEWGARGLQSRMADAWAAFMVPVMAAGSASAPWMRVVEGHGAAVVEQVYRALLDGTVPADEGHVLSLTKV